MTETTLCRLAAKWGTDKTPSICHGYTPYYHELFKGRNIKRLLEIGVGCSRVHPGIPTGASLHMWEEYFPEAEIYGLDINPDSLINEGRIHCFLCDQGNEESLRKTAASLGGRFDLIIDDGSHLPEHQVLSAKVLIPLLLNPDGLYIIEDVWAPEQVTPHLPWKHEVKDFHPEIYISDRLIIIQGNDKCPSHSLP